MHFRQTYNILQNRVYTENMKIGTIRIHMKRIHNYLVSVFINIMHN